MVVLGELMSICANLVVEGGEECPLECPGALAAPDCLLGEQARRVVIYAECAVPGERVREAPLDVTDAKSGRDAC